MLNEEVYIEIHWPNNPIPIEETNHEDNSVFEINFGVFSAYPLSMSTSPVQSVNGRTGDIVLGAVDVGADPIGTAELVRTQLADSILQVLSLAQTNELKISTKADQLDLETTQIQVENNRLAILTKADIQSLALLAQLVDTKADQSYVNQQIADLVGSAPEALNTIYELAAAIQNDQSLIDSLNQSVANRVRFDIATQALTEIQKQNARANIGAEQLGTAQQLVSQITAQSLGAATAAQGTKADTALQSADVAPVALSGLFSSLSSQNKIFDVVFNNYVIGSNNVISAADTLGEMLGKLQAQFGNWVNGSSIGVYHPFVQSGQLQFRKAHGNLYVRGTILLSAQIPTNTTLFEITDLNYKPIYDYGANATIQRLLFYRTTMAVSVYLDKEFPTNAWKFRTLSAMSGGTASDLWTLPETCLGVIN